MQRNKIQAVQKTSLVDMVEKNLLAYFRKANLKPGDSLPGEIELTDLLGVGRSVIREALSRFRMVGLIDSKPGKGMILKEPSLFNGFERVVNPRLLSKETLLDLLGFRLVLEMGAAEFIFINLTEEDIKDLEVIQAREIKYKNNRFDPESDAQFHMRLLQICGNSSVADFQRIVFPLFEFIKENYDEIFEGKEANLNVGDEAVTHADIIESLKNRDLEQYKKLLRKHLDLYFQLLK
ncbi:FCD domain-containing protein [Halosquirtibacter xylanolyticus]|uniref:FadR/GntR family transcriptional regulator n=1 Tax=Halosquirtibacter xylanolyticus TaxID=3374599 RepID=UPI0037496C4D|nr:FCD domain-containing protein [Prolixibacteraceae bacterium]